MPDEPEQPTDRPELTPDLTPEQDREVRRLLADARHTEPMPVDVAARLDRVLADLATQETDHTEPDTSAPGAVVSLASRRRRRAATLLVAAASVVAVGVGLDQLTRGAGSGSSSSSAGSAQSQDLGSGSRSAAKPEKQSPNASLDSPHAAGTPATKGRLLDLPHAVPVRSGHFAADVARARRLTEVQDTSGTLDNRHRGFSCTPDGWGRGTFVPVRYDGRRGVLVLRAVHGDTQVADLYGCGSPQVLRSITLPAR